MTKQTHLPTMLFASDDQRSSLTKAIHSSGLLERAAEYCHVLPAGSSVYQFDFARFVGDDPFPFEDAESDSFVILLYRMEDGTLHLLDASNTWCVSFLYAQWAIYSGDHSDYVAGDETWWSRAEIISLSGSHEKLLEFVLPLKLRG